MAKTPKAPVARMGEQIGLLLAQAGMLFKPGVMLTFVARVPGNPEADMLISSDDLGEVMKAVERSKAREEFELS